jgi:F-box/leucine-rich repeat protein 2/20
MFVWELVVQGCYVGDQGLKAVGRFCKQLEELNLRFCEGVSDAGVVGIAEGCGKSLKSLGIAACARVTDVALHAVGSHCVMLKKFTLDSECIQTDGVLAVAQGCSQLQMLRLQCVNVSDEALQVVGRNCTLLETLALFSFQKFTDR